MVKVTVIPARYAHVARIGNRMRQIDVAECEAMGRAPKQALRIGLATSDKVWTACVDGLPEAMFGVTVDSVINRRGTPWFLGSDEVYRHGRELLAWGPGFVARMGDSLTLSNLVSADNSKAIRLLKRWGFEVGEEEIDVRGTPFLRFERVG
jgi:hypothetical protein